MSQTQVRSLWMQEVTTLLFNQFCISDVTATSTGVTPSSGFPGTLGLAPVPEPPGERVSGML